MKFKTASIILSLVLFIAPGALLPSAFCKEDKAEQEQAALALVRDYEARLGELAGEIDELKENRVWLQLKVDEVKLLGKPVPAALSRSLAYKTSRIQALEESARGVSNYLEEVRQRLPAPMPVVQGAGADGLRKEISDHGLLEWFKMDSGPNGRVVLESTLPILFSSGSAVVAESYRPFLEQVAGFVKNRKAWILVDGYTDTDPIRTKKFPSNFELGAIRAANIVHALVDLGADPAMFRLASTGEYRFPEARPLSENKSMERYVNLTMTFE